MAVVDLRVHLHLHRGPVHHHLRAQHHTRAHRQGENMQHFAKVACKFTKVLYVSKFDPDCVVSFLRISPLFSGKCVQAIADLMTLFLMYCICILMQISLYCSFNWRYIRTFRPDWYHLVRQRHGPGYQQQCEECWTMGGGEDYMYNLSIWFLCSVLKFYIGSN